MTSPLIHPSPQGCPDHCFHCGETLPAEAVVLSLNGTLQRFCCTGCAGAAEWIATAGLGDYYRLRQAQALKVSDQEGDFSLWDRPEIHAEHVRQTTDGDEITILTDGMQCAACAWLIDRALCRREGVKSVSANAITGRVRIVWDAAATRLSDILQDMAGLGYRVHLSPGQAREEARQRERRRSILRLGIAGLGAMQAMMFTEALYLDFHRDMAIPTRDFMRWLAFLLATPVVFYSGWPFLAGMWRELRLRRFGMDTLVATSVLLAYFASLFETLRGGMHVWFDASVMFVLFLLIAREIETAVRARATEHVDTLARIRPAFAHREISGHDVEAVPVMTLKPGDIVRVMPGEAVPADGTALETATLDESLLTGESTPVVREAGEEVHAGSLASGHTVRLQVTQVGQATWLSQLTRLIERAQEERPVMAQLADRVASRFVMALFMAAAVTCLWWLEHDPSRAFEVTLAVLVVACPCALSLAIPAALASAHAALAREGILAIHADALARLAQVDTVVFDKTGTLTQAQSQLSAVEVFGDCTRALALGMAAILERDSRHPLARAFQQRIASLPDDVSPLHQARVQQIPGMGVEAALEGQCWRLGQAGFAAAQPDDGAIWLGDGRRPFARFAVADPLRPDARACVTACQALGLSCELLSGDGEQSVAEAANQLKIPHFAARQTPEQKLAHIRQLQQQGRRVLMVGDGINDAPVLGGADISMAMHSGAALAQGAAGLVLTGQSLSRIPHAIQMARQTRRIIRQNLFWALGYNALALPFAAAGWVAPWLAALGMAASSLIVTLNAMRLVRHRHLPVDSSFHEKATELP